MSLLARSKNAMRRILAGLGYGVQRFSPEERWFDRGYDPTTPLPHGAEEYLRPDHPRLRELERRYAAFDSPVCQHTQWRPELRTDVDDLRHFRGETVYLWHYLKLGQRLARHELVRLKYFIYARYVRDLDHRGLLGSVLVEDGQFGCFSFRFHDLPAVSRDLLDSVNELYFLDRHWNLFARESTRVLDIGAGYGRLAHRMLQAVPATGQYACIDAIPRSTFLCEYYLRHRGLLGEEHSRAVVVPLDEMHSGLHPGSYDLAVNIHSFSEMSHASVRAWLDVLATLNVPSLLVVPNEPELHSREANGSRKEYLGLIGQSGYELVAREPTIRDPNVRELFGTNDYFHLFRRK